MNNEIKFDVDVNVLWHDDTMELTENVARSLSGWIESEIAQHFEVDLSDLREYIRLKQEGGKIAEVRHGRWIKPEDPTCYKCSACGKYRNQQQGYAAPIFDKYCPNCGARMDLQEVENNE